MRPRLVLIAAAIRLQIKTNPREKLDFFKTVKDEC